MNIKLKKDGAEEKINKWIIKNDIIPVILLLFLFSLLCILPQLDLPGLGGDESQAPSAFIYMTQFKNPQVYAFSIGAFGKIFPIMDRPYQSSLYTYLYLPFAYSGGVNIYTVRIANIFYGLLIIILCYISAKELLGIKKALISTLLIVTLPFFVLGIKIDAQYHIQMIPALALFLSCLKFYNTKKRAYLYIGSFVLGLGVYYGVTFWVFAIPALLVAYLYIFKKVRLYKRTILMILIFFLIGSSPLIYYNIKSTGETIKYVMNPFFGDKPVSLHDPRLFLQIGDDLKMNPFFKKESAGIMNDGFMEMIKQNMVTRFYHFKSILLGNFFARKIGMSNPLGLFLVLFALGFSIFKIINPRIPENEKLVSKMLLFLFIVFVFFSSLASSEFTRIHALMITIPILFMLATDFLGCLYKKNKALTALFFLSIIILNLVIITKINSDINRYGDFPPEHPSDSIYALADYFYENKITEPVNIGRGFSTEDFQTNTFTLTKGRSYPFNLFRMYNPKEYFQNLAKKPETVYVLPAVDKVKVPFSERETYKLFQSYTREINKTIVLEKIFTNRAGEPEFIVYKLK